MGTLAVALGLKDWQGESFFDAPILAIHQYLRFVMLALLDQLQDTLPASLHPRCDEIMLRRDGVA